MDSGVALDKTTEPERNWVFYDPTYGTVEHFATKEEAYKRLRDGSFDGLGFRKEVEDGKHWVAEIRARSAVEIVEHRKDYPCAKHPDRVASCSSCEEYSEECRDVAEWPYDPDFVYICRLVTREGGAGDERN